jgi:glutathione S-transferase
MEDDMTDGQGHQGDDAGTGPIRLHHVPQTRSFRVLWLLHEAGIPHKVVRHDLFDRALRGPDYLALSPAGRVPAVEIGALRMVESGAILEYLTETRAPRLGRAPGSTGRAAYLQWLHYAETLGQHIAILTQQHIALRDAAMRSPVVMRIEAVRLARALAPVVRAAGDGWLLPDGFSSADIAVGYALRIAAHFVRLAEVPGAEALLARYAARPAFVAALAAEGPPQLYLRDFYAVPDA